jgi:hypothetical protein
MARAMMNERDISQKFWLEVVHLVVYILNKAHLRPNNDKTPHELWFGRPSSIKHFKVFGSKCYINNDDDHLINVHSRYDEGILLGYSMNSKGYIFFHKRLHKLVDCIDVRIDKEAPVKDQHKISTKSNEEEDKNNEDEEHQISES